MNIFIFLIGAVLSQVCFTMFFNSLDQWNIHVFKSLQNFVKKYKTKWMFNFSVYVIVVLATLMITSVFRLDDLGFGITLGFFMSVKHAAYQTENKDDKNKKKK
ncbi:hypothetical protein RH915_09070 [Serpentinicella sp. ANB-PHB4]|uniref:hypothetical protein n=1 Tax=Serpentinicella sp. ANB-PHB4 TaxID=3074076 RepID=UPI002866A332|nr:hypothetical protein [Serpentinicella sp. ANB-PHB4]MDR5659645.1 hypothetical protein [Serpentinicella sp. ANB-PHB4]